MASDLPALIARLEAATGGDREIDALIATGCAGARLERYAPGARQHIWRGPDNEWLTRDANPPAYTSDLNAIVALIEKRLPGADFIDVFRDAGHWFASLTVSEGVTPRIDVSAPTPALALCIAFVRALSETDNELLPRLRV